jgi:GNAT superfamily N-acetyltransferase
VHRGERRDGWIGSLRRGDRRTNEPFRVRAGRVVTARATPADGPSHPDPGTGRVKVRAAVDGDLGAILAVSASTEHDHSAYLRGAVGKSEVLVAFDDRDGRSVIGFLVWNTEFFTMPFVWLIVVVPSYRRSGVAWLLFDAVEKTCSGQRIFTSTNRSNQAMQCFLNARGYRRSGKIELDPGDPDVFYQLTPSGGA